MVALFEEPELAENAFCCEIAAGTAPSMVPGQPVFVQLPDGDGGSESVGEGVALQHRVGLKVPPDVVTMRAWAASSAPDRTTNDSASSATISPMMEFDRGLSVSERH